jgi:hypothetical protein
LLRTARAMRTERAGNRLAQVAQLFDYETPMNINSDVVNERGRPSLFVQLVTVSGRGHCSTQPRGRESTKCITSLTLRGE